MRKTSSFPAVILLLALTQIIAIPSIIAQNDAQDNGFFLRVTIAGISKDYYQGDCGYGYSDGWGGEVSEEMCTAAPTWAYDSTLDSLVCDTITASLTDKFALVRRGICSFSQKAFYAQQAGAKAVIIVNHYYNVSENDCTVNNMVPGLYADSVHIPVVFVGRAIGETIDQAIQTGQAVTICFLFLRLYHAVAAYHYATPISQVDTLHHIGIRYVNRSADNQSDVVLKADLRAPDGSVVSLTKTLDVAAGLDTFVYFPAYLPPALLGRFEVTYSNSVYTEPRDSVRRSFFLTPYTFATDNLDVDPSAVLFSPEPFIYQQQTGGLCRTGPNGGVAQYATFGISNAAEIVGQDADEIAIVLYDGDPNNDGIIDLNNGFTDLDDLPGGQLGFAIYTMTGAEPGDSLITVAFSSFTSGPIVLKPRHPYYISLFYDSSASTTLPSIAFSKSSKEQYLDFPTTPVFINDWYPNGYPTATIIQRLQMEGYPANLVQVKPEILDASKVVITPNPANDQLRLDLNLAKVHDQVTVSLIDWTGRFVSTQVLKNFQSGQTSFDVSALPSGSYLVQVRSKEGKTMRKVAVCH